jgi:hypothetical protein
MMIQVGDCVEITFARRGTFPGVALECTEFVDWQGRSRPHVLYSFLVGDQANSIWLPAECPSVGLARRGTVH